MKFLRMLGLAAVVAFVFAVAATRNAQAQISVEIGAAPDCPYGYYDYAPYACSPSGYYGPQWFTGGVFIGAGRWFHGPANFHGTVNNRFDPRHGYKGATPAVHEQAQPHTEAFKGNEERDGRGNKAKR